MLRAARAKFALTSAPSMTSARFQPRPFSACASSLVLPSARLAWSMTIELARAGLGRERVLQPERAELLVQVVGVAARRRPLVGAAVAEGRRLARAVPGAAGALLAVDLLGRVADLGLAEHRVGARLPLGQLPAHDAVQDVRPRRRARRSRRRARSSPPGSRRARSRRVSFLLAPFPGGFVGLPAFAAAASASAASIAACSASCCALQRLGLGGGGLLGGLARRPRRRRRRRSAARRAGSRCRAWPS